MSAASSEPIHRRPIEPGGGVHLEHDRIWQFFLEPDRQLLRSVDITSEVRDHLLDREQVGCAFPHEEPKEVDSLLEGPDRLDQLPAPTCRA